MHAKRSEWVQLERGKTLIKTNAETFKDTKVMRITRKSRHRAKALPPLSWLSRENTQMGNLVKQMIDLRHMLCSDRKVHRSVRRATQRVNLCASKTTEPSQLQYQLIDRIFHGPFRPLRRLESSRVSCSSVLRNFNHSCSMRRETFFLFPSHSATHNPRNSVESEN